MKLITVKLHENVLLRCVCMHACVHTGCGHLCVCVHVIIYSCDSLTNIFFVLFLLILTVKCPGLVGCPR